MKLNFLIILPPTVVSVVYQNESLPHFNQLSAPESSLFKTIKMNLLVDLWCDNLEN